MTLGAYIREGRKSRGDTSQAKLAELVTERGPPASQQLVSFWETDDVIPKADQLEAIADALSTLKLDRLHELAAEAETRRRMSA